MRQKDAGCGMRGLKHMVNLEGTAFATFLHNPHPATRSSHPHPASRISLPHPVFVCHTRRLVLQGTEPVRMDQINRGIFITFEGSEGCGKTTQFERLAHRLCNEPATAGRRLVTLREPGGTPVGEEIRRLLKHTAPGWSILPEAELLLFAASRAQLVREVLTPLLAEGALVMCDRFLDSTTVYQGVARRLDPRDVAAINEFAAGPLRPDVTFLLDLPTEVALARLQSRSRWANLPPDRMELELPAFYEEVRAGYLQLAAAHAGRFVVIDASGSTEEIEASIWQQLTERFHGFRTLPGV